jgi:thiol-disulfide isomerase/thioredoxin
MGSSILASLSEAGGNDPELPVSGPLPSHTLVSSDRVGTRPTQSLMQVGCPNIHAAVAHRVTIFNHLRAPLESGGILQNQFGTRQRLLSRIGVGTCFGHADGCYFADWSQLLVVRRSCMRHNGVAFGVGMNKYFVLVLAVAAGLVGIAIGIAAGRSNLATVRRTPDARAHLEPARAVTPVKNASPAQSNQMPVIRFASNPQAIPPFLARDINGEVVSSAEWHGKVVLLNFWATWCPPCREEIPELIDLETRYKDRFQVIGISMDDPEDVGRVKRFSEKEGVNYPIVMASREILMEYGGVPALPTSFVVNTDTRIVQKHVGLYPTFVYETELRSLLGLPVEAKVETFEDTGQIFLKNAALATELPDVDFTGLSPELKKAALRRLNSEGCTCGCQLTLAQCRINDTSCPFSKKLAAQAVKEIAAGSSVTTDAPPVPAPASVPNQ